MEVDRTQAGPYLIKKLGTNAGAWIFRVGLLTPDGATHGNLALDEEVMLRAIEDR